MERRETRIYIKPCDHDKEGAQRNTRAPRHILCNDTVLFLLPDGPLRVMYTICRIHTATELAKPFLS